MRSYDARASSTPSPPNDAGDGFPSSSSFHCGGAVTFAVTVIRNRLSHCRSTLYPPHVSGPAWAQERAGAVESQSAAVTAACARPNMVDAILGWNGLGRRASGRAPACQRFVGEGADARMVRGPLGPDR